MPPAVPPEEPSAGAPLHHHFEIVDEESLHLLVAAASDPLEAKGKSRYCSFDDTLSTSIMSSTCTEELSDEENIIITKTPAEPYAKPSCYERVWNAYYNKLQQYPLIVKSITAFVLLLLADLMAQGVEHLRGISKIHHGEADAVVLLPVNWLRALRFGVFGFLGAPWTHYYYHWLDTVLPPTPYPWTCTTLGASPSWFALFSLFVFPVTYLASLEFSSQSK
jgi:hypothetical protein